MLAVLAVQRPLAPNKSRTEDRGWIGTFGLDGLIRHEVSFVLNAGDKSIKTVDAFLSTSRNEHIIAGQSEDGATLLVSVNELGLITRLGSFGKNNIDFIISLPKGNLLVGGRKGNDLFSARLESTGKVIWERDLIRGRDRSFISGISNAGGTVALEEAGIQEQFFVRDATLKVTVIEDKGVSTDLTKFSIPGRAGAMIAFEDGYAGIVDEGVGIKQRLKFFRLNSEFKPVLTADFLKINFSLERARLARIGRDNFLVAALDGGHLIGLRLDSSGAVLGRYDSPAGRFFLHVDTPNGSNPYLVSTEISEISPGGGVKEEVHIVRFKAK
jgi:hypothetical protein